MPTSSKLPKISIVIVNYNGVDHLPNCLDSLRDLEYPSEQKEVIVIDNASTDGSCKLVRENYSEVKVIKNKKNKGFAAGVNQGAKTAEGEYVALLNNDMKVDSKWLIELIRPILEDREVICVGSRVLDWEGKNIDFIGSMMNFEGRGFQIDFGKPLSGEKDENSKHLLFVNGGAMLVNRQVFFELGGFDEDYFAYYEDVDFGWRVWICGYKVLYVPSSLVYHRHHGTSKRIKKERLDYLYERNGLYTIFKNYSWENLKTVFPAVLLLLLKRISMDSKINRESYKDFSFKEVERSKPETVTVAGASRILAAEEFINNLPHLWKKRQAIQLLRKRTDESLFHLFGGEFLSILPDKEYQKIQMELQKTFGIYEMFQQFRKTRVLIITHEVVSEKMAGPGIRSWELAKVLSKKNEVTLAVPNKSPLKHSSFSVKTYEDANTLKDFASGSEVILCEGPVLALNSFLADMNKIIIVDLYDPFILSQLEQQKELELEKRSDEYQSSLNALTFQLAKGDFFICASEKQRDFWIGMFSALGRIKPRIYDSDVTLRNLIDVVPFGLPSEEPIHSRQVMKGVIPGIKDGDKVVLWGGGIYNWFDPLSLIEAMAEIRDKRKNIKLYFMGTKHPNPHVPKMKMCFEAVELSKKLGLYEETVFFNFDWVPYKERANYLLEADIGVSMHLDHAETRFSFRTRILDCIWAALPVVCTKGDSISELVEEKRLGITVPIQDVGKIASAILRLVDDNKLMQKCTANLRKIAEEYQWQQVSKPLIDFCANPFIAVDKLDGRETLLWEKMSKENGRNSYRKRIIEVYQEHGLIETIKRGVYFVRTRI